MTDEHDLLAAARRALSPTAADQERVRRATTAALAAGATGGAIGGAAGSRALPWASRLVVVGIVAAVAAGIGYRAGLRTGREDATLARPPVAMKSAATTASAATGSTSESGPPSVTPAALPVDGQTAKAPMHRRVVADAGVALAAPSASLAEEVRALRAVERALRDGNPGFALALLRELDRAVPNGQLVEERLATRTIARCAGGDVPIGVNLADDFATQYPDSVYGRRVADACATDSQRPGDTAGRRSSDDKN